MLTINDGTKPVYPTVDFGDLIARDLFELDGVIYLTCYEPCVLTTSAIALNGPNKGDITSFPQETQVIKREGELRLIPLVNPIPSNCYGILPEELTELRTKGKIQAIRMVRIRTGAGLRDSKRLVDLAEEHYGSLLSQTPVPNATVVLPQRSGFDIIHKDPPGTNPEFGAEEQRHDDVKPARDRW